MRVTTLFSTKLFRNSVIVIFIGILVFLFSESSIIAGAFSIFVALFFTMVERKSTNRRASEIQSACPEMIDHLISGLQSGLSLNESLVGLASRGPAVLKPHFKVFSEMVYASGDFLSALESVKSELAQPSTDLIIESLLISKALGGAELMTILRLLGNFIREDLALRREIAVKQNWIKNSAHLSAAAPWILLLLLSTQPSTAEAFSTSSGVLILMTGLLLTTIAYLWMNHLGKLPEQTRIFAGTL